MSAHNQRPASPVFCMHCGLPLSLCFFRGIVLLLDLGCGRCRNQDGMEGSLGQPNLESSTVNLTSIAVAAVHVQSCR